MKYPLTLVFSLFVFGCFAKLVNAYYEKKNVYYVLPDSPSSIEDPYSF